MPADTVRSPEYLLERLGTEGPDLRGATALLSRAGRDLITTLQPQMGEQVVNYTFTEYPDVITGGAGGAATAARQLTASVAARVRFGRVPFGVNGTDTAHYIRIVDPNGTSEAVLITGGAGTSGALNGEITFTPANSHSGSAWYITSASGGWVEQMTEHPTAISEFPAGALNLYAAVTTSAAWPGGRGQGFYRSFIDAYFTGTDILNTPSTYLTIRDVQIRPRSGVMTTGAALNFTSTSYVTLENVYLGAEGGDLCVYKGVKMVGGKLITRHLWINAEFRGLELSATSFSLGDSTYVVGERTKDNYIAQSCALYITAMTTGDLSGFWHAAGVMAYGIIVDTGVASFVNEVHIKGLYLDNHILGGIDVRGTGTAYGWSISDFRIVDSNGFFGNSVGSRGLQFNGAANGWHITNGSILYAYAYGVDFTGSANNVVFDAVTIAACAVTAGSAAGNAAMVASGGAPTNIVVGRSCSLGEPVDGVTTSTYGFFSSRAIDGLDLSCRVGAGAQVNKIVLGGTETDVTIDCPGIGNVRKTVAAAATLTFPLMNDSDVIEITGSTALATAVAGLREGQKGVMVWTDASPGAVSQVATIASPGFTPTQYQPYPWMFSNGKLYVG